MKSSLLQNISFELTREVSFQNNPEQDENSKKDNSFSLYEQTADQTPNLITLTDESIQVQNPSSNYSIVSPIEQTP